MLLCKFSARSVEKWDRRVEFKVVHLVIFYPFVIRVSTFVWENSTKVLVRARNSSERDRNGLKTEWEHNCDAENPFPSSALGSGCVQAIDCATLITLIPL